LRAEAEVACPLCGRHFPSQEGCSVSCPLHARCHTLCCPHCNYRFVEDSAIVRLMQRLVIGLRR
jgi:hypothetical protein